MKALAVVATGLALIAGVAVAGYLIGRDQATTSDDASAARRTGYRTAYAKAFAKARERALVEGRRAGDAEGQSTGSDAGRQAGNSDGDADVATELAAQAEAQVAAEQQAAVQEAQERASNCGAPLFVEGYCPSDEEIAQENQAEALCGPGTAEGRAEAARLGIQC